MITAEQLCERVDSAILIQLTDSNAVEIDMVKVARRLADAWAEIEGYTYKLSPEALPPVSTLERHQAEIALYLLAGNRPGEEFKSYAARYAASIRYLEGLRDDAGGANVDVGADDYAPLMDPSSLSTFGDPEVLP